MLSSVLDSNPKMYCFRDQMYMFPILENLANSVMLYVWVGLMVSVLDSRFRDQCLSSGQGCLVVFLSKTDKHCLFKSRSIIIIIRVLKNCSHNITKFSGREEGRSYLPCTSLLSRGDTILLTILYYTGHVLSAAKSYQ